MTNAVNWPEDYRSVTFEGGPLDGETMLVQEDEPYFILLAAPTDELLAHLEAEGNSDPVAEDLPKCIYSLEQREDRWFGVRPTGWVR